jgi:hypothetical protein
MLRVVAAAAAAALGAGALLNYTSFGGAPYAVTYDNRSLMLNGQRALFLSAGIHYPRSTPQQWADLFTKAVADGHNQVRAKACCGRARGVFSRRPASFAAVSRADPDVRVLVCAPAPRGGLGEERGASGAMWIGWSPQPRPPRRPQDFTFQNDLRRFITMAGEKGLFTYLRIGPYICAETQFGGYPPWLTYSACNLAGGEGGGGGRAGMDRTSMRGAWCCVQSPTWSPAPAAAGGRRPWEPSSTAPWRTCGTCLLTAAGPSSWRKWKMSCTPGAVQAVRGLTMAAGTVPFHFPPPPPPPPRVCTRWQ